MQSILGIGVLALLATLPADEEQAKKIKLADCPEAVQKTLKRQLGNGRLVDVDVRDLHGVAVYESEVWFGDQNMIS